MEELEQLKENKKKKKKKILIKILVFVLFVFLISSCVEIEDTENEPLDSDIPKTTLITTTTTTTPTTTTTTKSLTERKKEYSKVSYKDLARKPKNYEGKKAYFYGEVLQVMEDEGGFFSSGDKAQLRIATKKESYGDYYYDDVIYAVIDNYDMNNRILEEDRIYIYGKLTGTISYESLLGETITIPSIQVDFFEIK